MSDVPQILMPFNQREAISLKQASKIAGRSESTLRTWCVTRNVGRRIAGGPWQVSRAALQMLLDGNEEGLRAYLAGDRNSTLVAPYLRAVGIAV